jgi:ABC-type multidrug transport system ATPase subunit
MKVQLNQVGKRFKYEWIFRGINREFRSGQSYAIQGPNGSGKSTLLKILSGHLSPSKGKISFFQDEQAIDINQVYQSISYAAPYIDLIEDFTLKEAIDFHRQFKPLLEGLSTKDLIGILSFEKSANKAVKYFSSGMKQRLKLVLALCSSAELILLDEPGTNLDQQGIEWYRGLVDRFHRDRLLIIASNVKADFDFCDQHLNILDYKKKV